MGVFWLCMYIFVSQYYLSSPSLIMPRPLGQCFSKKGDIILGFLVNMNDLQEAGHCAPTLYLPERAELMEAFDYIINLINVNDDILPNLSIGYVAYEICFDYLTSLGQSLHMLPSVMGENEGECGEDFTHHQVAGVVGVITSRQAILISSVLSLFQIPIIGTTSSSDELSDRSRFEYFLRTVPPDRYQAKAILDLMVHFNWTYASLLYSTGSYGENGAKALEAEAKEKGVCFPVAYRIPSDPLQDDLDFVIQLLQKNSKARVVILFTSRSTARKLFKYVSDMEIHTDSIWIGGDALAVEDFGPAADGMLTVDFAYGQAPKFKDHIETLTPFNSLNKPWLWNYWEQIYGCEWGEFFDEGRCKDMQNSTQVGVSNSGAFTKVLDATQALALGINDLISDVCSNDIDNTTHCVNGPDLLDYIKNVEFDGWSGYIKFNQEGALIGQYTIRQYVYGAGEHYIGLWDQESSAITLQESAIEWEIYSKNRSGIPDSVCSEPCHAKQYAIYMELPCCWQCRICRNNEILKPNNSGCSLCPENYWPDEESATVCQVIPASYMHWSDSIVMGLLILSTLGIIVSLAIVVLFTINKDNKLIKAASRGLSTIILIGIMMSFIAVFTFLAKPSPAICVSRFVLFMSSVSLIYSPLLVKTNRVYRIFSAGKKGVQKIQFISSETQVVFTSAVFIIEVVLVIVAIILYPPSVSLRMPVPSVKHSELFCELPLVTLLIPLAYNLFLLLLCAGYGFLTRKLPENFNESWYIFLSVSTTMLLWMVFLPTYFTTFYAYYQAALLAFCLALNAFVSVLCLYVPKLYAIYFLGDSNVILVNSSSITRSQVAPSTA